MLTRLEIQCIYSRKSILADLVQGEKNIPHLVTLIPTQARETNLIAWQRKSPKSFRTRNHRKSYTHIIITHMERFHPSQIGTLSTRSPSSITEDETLFWWPWYTDPDRWGPTAWPHWKNLRWWTIPFFPDFFFLRFLCVWIRTFTFLYNCEM